MTTWYRVADPAGPRTPEQADALLAAMAAEAAEALAAWEGLPPWARSGEQLTPSG